MQNRGMLKFDQFLVRQSARLAVERASVHERMLIANDSRR
jgi:hypothetical protein